MTGTHVLTAAHDLHAADDPRRWFLASSRLVLRDSMRIAPWELPEPYRELLVHDGSMTERLESHAGARMTLQTLSVRASAVCYARWIVLRDDEGRPREIGAVCLDLRRVGAGLRDAVLEGNQPLGRLLSWRGRACRSVPYSFHVCRATEEVRVLLRMPDIRRLFGRRTVLRAGSDKIGDVLELLPCTDRSDS